MRKKRIASMHTYTQLAQKNVVEKFVRDRESEQRNDMQTKRKEKEGEMKQIPKTAHITSL